MQKDLVKKASLAAIGYTIGAILLVVLVVLDLSSLSSTPNLTQFISVLKVGLPYLLAAIVCSASATLSKILFKGTLITPISRMFTNFFVAFMAYFALTIQFMASQIQALGIYVFLLIITFSVYYFLNFMVQSYRQITLLAFLRFSVLAVSGVILRFAILSYFASKGAILSDILLYGFLFAAATTLFYPLKYSQKSAIKKTGDWLGTRTLHKVVLGLILAGYALFLRSYLLQMNANATLIGEWIFVGLVTVFAYFRLKSKLDDISAPLILETWQKHHQELGFKTTEEFRTLSEEVNAFLQRGEKNGVLLFLFHFLFERKVYASHIDLALNEIINYQDPPKPRLVFSWDDRFFEEAKLQKRKQVLDQTIKSLSADLFSKINLGVESENEFPRNERKC